MQNLPISNPGETRATSSIENRSPYFLLLIWLVWLPLTIPPIIESFQHHPPLPRLITILVGAVLFFGIYLWSAWHRAQRLVAMLSLPGHTEVSTWLAIVAMTLLSLLLIWLGGNGWQALLFYTSGCIGGSLPIRRAVLVAVAIALLAVLVGWLIGSGWVDLVQVLVFIPAIVLITRSVIWSITTSWQLQAAREELARLAVMEERLRIARDLHDLLGHNLSIIALKSELAGRLIGMAPERAVVEIGDIEHVARTTLQEVREAVGNYRRPTLASELQGAQEILAAAAIAYQYDGHEHVIGTLPTVIEAVLAWTVREGVTNVVRHSHAQHCTIHVKQERQMACVEVIDNGADGADTGTPSALEVAAAHKNGLRGLAERVEALGGQFTAGPAADGGFRLAVALPLAQRADISGAATVSPLQQTPLTPLDNLNSEEERSVQP